MKVDTKEWWNGFLIILILLFLFFFVGLQFEWGFLLIFVIGFVLFVITEEGLH